jgi:hydroquinone glucosyltransferase
MALNDSALNLFLQTKVILEIGPLLPEAQFCDDETGDHIIKETTHEKHPCILWLNLQVPSSVLFISFGSVATLSAPQILDLAAGIEASNQPFLWILRPPDAPMVTHGCDGALPALEFLPPGISTGSRYYPFWNQRPYNP